MIFPKKTPIQLTRQGPLINTQLFEDTKDPCPVFDGKKWHLYGSGGTIKTESWQILHATADLLSGPWAEQRPAELIGVSGEHFAAPGVVYDMHEKKFQMFIQSEFTAPGGNIEYFVSHDGEKFFHTNTALHSIPGTREAGIYDPHPSIVTNKKGVDEYYITYVGYPDVADEINHTDIYLAKSASKSWNGPWIRLGHILRQEEVNHHNQSDQHDYEWGLEGPQLLQLPSGRLLLNAVCFLPKGVRGNRQRIFFAYADHVQGPYKTLGTVMDPELDPWGSAENGHAAALIDADILRLFYQARALNGSWRYGMASCKVADIERIIEKHKKGKRLDLFDLFNKIKFPLPSTVRINFKRYK
jgi:hypothetical protein